jgi:putative SOS response-associated peptidase YedK
MCARYYIDNSVYDEIEPDVGKIPQEYRVTGDIRPSEHPCCIIAGENGLTATNEIAWGYPARDGKGLLINARAETILEKSTFRHGIASNRCLLPARGFYEWDGKKEKVSFFMTGKKTFFLAGCFDVFQGQKRFTLITTAANESMIQIHDRMPLIITLNTAKDWLFTEKYMDILAADMPMLETKKKYEQLTLDL